RQEEQRRQIGYAKPAQGLEIESRTWHPDDASAGQDKARYVIQEVRRARNLYETLGVKPSAAAKDVRNAYRQISLRIHPDKVRSRGGAEEAESLIREAEATFKIVSSAYEVLGDEGKRAAYHRTLRTKLSAPPATSRPQQKP
ncbi:unnamed protein product, partial [Polarella glacialis]